MKILFVGVFNPMSTNVSQAEAFERQGHEVKQYDYRTYRVSLGNEGMERNLVWTTETAHVDLVLFSKCNGMSADAVDGCNKYAKTALWYMDPLNGNFDVELVEKIKRCNHTFCALHKPFVEAHKYGKSVHFLHEGFDPKVDYPMVADNKVKMFGTTFIGNLRGERVRYHSEIGFKNLTGVFGKDHANAVGESRINLNFVDGNSGCSDRVYKVLAAKGFLLTQPWPDMEKSFAPGRDFAIFNSIGTLVSQMDKFIKDDEARATIAESGYRAVQKYSRDNWAKKIVEIVGGE